MKITQNEFTGWKKTGNEKAGTKGSRENQSDRKGGHRIRDHVRDFGSKARNNSSRGSPVDYKFILRPLKIRRALICPIVVSCDYSREQINANIN